MRSRSRQCSRTTHSPGSQWLPRLISVTYAGLSSPPPVHVMAFPSVANSVCVRSNSPDNLHICALVSPKTTTGKVASAGISSSAITAGPFSSSCHLLREGPSASPPGRPDHPSPESMCKCGNAPLLLCFAAGCLISAGRG